MMKKLHIIASLFLGIALFTACETDINDNPILKAPQTFTMNTPEFSNSAVDLLVSNSVVLKAATQPDYGFPTQVVYGAQMSMSDKAWTDSTKVYTLDGTTSTLTYLAGAEDIDRGIMVLEHDTVAAQIDANAVKTVYLRLTARLVNDTEGKTVVYSNSMPIKVYPYFISLKDAEPIFWYMIGGSIGDGTWTNNSSFATYLSIFPMSLEKEYAYDKKSGLGEIRSTIYLAADGSAKLIFVVGKWDDQWGVSGGNFVKNDGGSGNIAPTAGAGFYTITYNTKKDAVTMVKAANQEPTTYASMGVIGLNGNWDNDVVMQPAAGAGANNHMWTAQVTVDKTTAFKFRANGNWDANWGFGAFDGEVNAYGFVSAGGKNIGLEPGQYTIYFNDIDGFFRVVRF